MSQPGEIEEYLSQVNIGETAQNNEDGGIFTREKEAGGGRSWEQIEIVLLNRSGVFNRKKRSGGSRSGNPELCLISPQKLVEKNTAENATETPIEVWSDRPLFIWQENSVNKQMVIIYSAEGEQEIWSKEVTSGDNSVAYDHSSPLQPGEMYRWQLSLQDSIQFPTQSVEIPFKVMETQKREAIQQDLQAIESQLSGETVEVIALEKANYFIEKDLWSDALQIMFSVDNPSEELRETINQIKSHNFCSS
ncbi:MAG: DUF928 domain-containing protein [Microcoleaceae cyanobacterium]